jgi:hypothetical protein
MKFLPYFYFCEPGSLLFFIKFFLRANYFMGHFKGYFEGDKFFEIGRNKLNKPGQSVSRDIFLRAL